MNTKNLSIDKKISSKENTKKNKDIKKKEINKNKDINKEKLYMISNSTNNSLISSIENREIININEWKNINYLDERNKKMINNYFKNIKGKFKFENDVLIVDIDNWGIEKIYLNNNKLNIFYNIHYENIIKLHNIALSFQIGSFVTFKKMELYLENFKNINVNIYFSLINDIVNDTTIEYLKNKYPNCVILSGENRGMDIGLFLISIHYIKLKKYNHDYLFKIHTKTNDNFRNETLNNLMGSSQKIISNIKLLSKKENGMISGNTIHKYNDDPGIFKSNFYHLENLISYLYNEKIINSNLQFASATFFIVKLKIFNVFTLDKIEYFYKNLNNQESLDYYWYSVFYNININNKQNIYKDYMNNQNTKYPNNIKYQVKTNKGGLRDCMIEHSFERLFGYICKRNGLDIVR